MQIVRGAPVGHVHRPHPQRSAAGCDGAGLQRVRVGKTRVARKTAGDIVQADSRTYGGAVPAPRAMVGHGVAERSDGVHRERVGADLGLLQADHVRRGLLQPFHQPGQPGQH
jgi:hypothetical protein